MAKTTSRSSNVSENPEIVDTGGELLDDDTHIDLVMTADSGVRQLLYWTRETITIAPEIRYQGRLYRPANWTQVFKRQCCYQARPLTMASCLFFSNVPATNSETIVIEICGQAISAETELFVQRVKRLTGKISGPRVRSSLYKPSEDVRLQR